MQTNEQIIKDIESVLAIIETATQKYNNTLTDAMDTLTNTIDCIKNNTNNDNEQEHIMNETWEIVQELFNMSYDERTAIFDNQSTVQIIKTYSPLSIKERMTTYRENEKITSGDKVKHKQKGTQAIILAINPALDNHWYVLTKTGYVESWMKYDFIKTNEHIDLF